MCQTHCTEKIKTWNLLKDHHTLFINEKFMCYNKKNRLEIIHFLFRRCFQINSKTVEDFFRGHKKYSRKSFFLPYKNTLSKNRSIMQVFPNKCIYDSKFLISLCMWQRKSTYELLFGVRSSARWRLNIGPSDWSPCRIISNCDKNWL